jgi:hypothetical protein
MLTTEQINDLHRLYWSDHWPIRKIERHLHMGWETIKKHLDMPAQTPAGPPRSSKLDPYKATIAELLEKDPCASAAVIGQRIQPLGYIGGGSILRHYVHEVRPQSKPQRAFVRMEPKPGERFEVDWGHFESLGYQGDQRKLTHSSARSRRRSRGHRQGRHRSRSPAVSTRPQNETVSSKCSALPRWRHAAKRSATTHTRAIGGLPATVFAVD